LSISARRGCRLGLEDEGLKQRRLAGHHELRGGQFGILDFQFLRSDAGIEIGRDLPDRVCQHRFIKAFADIGHALRDGHHGTDRRAAAGPTQQLDIGAAELAERGHCIAFRIEIEDSLALLELLLLDDRLEQRALVGEIDVERALGDAGGTRDLAHAGAVEAQIQEDFSRTVENLAALGAVFLADRREGGRVGGNHSFSLFDESAGYRPR
jgi:hypothetical protein